MNFLTAALQFALQSCVGADALNYFWIKLHQEMHSGSTPKALHRLTSVVWTYQDQLFLLGWTVIHIYIA